MSLAHTSLLAAAAILMAAPMAQAAPARPDPAIIKVIAPSGRLRAAINLGNGILAQRDAKTGELQGVSVQLAKALARELNLPIDLVAYHEAGATAEAGAKGEWDIAFLAIDPKRAETIAFTAPYVLIEGTYLVRASSPFRTIADVDHDGVKVGVAVGAAYDLYLTRALKHAQLVRAADGATALTEFDKGHQDVMAGVGGMLVLWAKDRPDMRVIEPGFQEIQQAMVTPKGREAGLAYVAAFLERMKASGFVRKALDSTGQTDAQVAPPAKP